MSESAPDPELIEALAESHLSLSSPQTQALERYCRSLWKWNAQLNLTRHTTFQRFVQRDLVDTWQLAQCLAPDEHVLDLGTGGGVPGVVLTVLRPDLVVTVCDSVAKKARAVAAIVEEARLPVRVVEGRAETILERASFDSVTARAVGPLAKILRWLEPHWDSMGRLLLIKGPKWVSERGEARHLGLLHGLDLRRLAQYQVPGDTWESVILSVRPSADE